MHNAKPEPPHDVNNYKRKYRVPKTLNSESRKKFRTDDEIQQTHFQLTYF